MAPDARAAMAAFPNHTVDSGDWLSSSWDNCATFADKSAVLFWGLEYIAFRGKEFGRWTSVLADFELHELADYGHFLAEEAPD